MMTNIMDYVINGNDGIKAQLGYNTFKEFVKLTKKDKRFFTASNFNYGDFGKTTILIHDGKIYDLSRSFNLYVVRDLGQIKNSIKKDDIMQVQVGSITSRNDSLYKKR